MRITQYVVRAAFVAGVLLFAPGAGSSAAQRMCTVPCGHPVHPYDVGPCSHPCYSSYGTVPCHRGDQYPCGHRLHPFDYTPCLGPESEIRD